MHLGSFGEQCFVNRTYKPELPNIHTQISQLNAADAEITSWISHHLNQREYFGAVAP